MSANLYDYPRYYDLVFGSDWKAEFHFLRQAFDKFCGPRVRRVFEPACGTGRLLYRLALAGYEVSGLDLNPRAVDYCNQRLARVKKERANSRLRTEFTGDRQFSAEADSHCSRRDQTHALALRAKPRPQASPAVVVGDMADFSLRRPVDAAFNTINSFRHLLSADQAQGHLQCLAAALRPGGIYVLGLHLTPTEGAPLEEESWSARRGQLGINTHLQTFDLDLRRRTERCTMTMDVYTPTRTFQIIDELVFRTYTRQQLFRLLATVPELELAAVFDFSYRIDEPIAIAPDTQDVVLILKRRD
jgi:SAM-dependent methyltransferase